MTSVELLIALAGALTTGAVGLLFFFVKKYFDKSDSERSEVKTDAKRLSEELGKLKIADAKIDSKLDSLLKQNKGITENISAMREMLQLQNREQIKLEARLDEHLQMNTSYIQTMGHMSRQLEAIFRYIDAESRPTDTHKVSG